MTLATEFQVLRRRYFPRWATVTGWTIRRGPRARWRREGEVITSSEMGYCDPVTKTLWIATATPSATRTQTLLHEMCHAVTSTGHGRQWQARMLCVADRAAARGDVALAKALANEVHAYATSPFVVTASVVYGRIQDMLLDNPSASLEHIIDHLASEYSATPQELLHGYRRITYWYARYRRDLADMYRVEAHTAVTFPALISLERVATIQQAIAALARES